jgi:hypothetical protein
MGRAALIVAGLALAACGSRPGAPVVLEQSADARLLVVELPDTVRVEVQSPRGIGRATLRRDGARWPGHVVLRLHLKGLEGLELVAGSDTVRRSEPTSAGPPASGWYEVEVPQELLTGEAELRVQWVDFYR